MVACQYFHDTPTPAGPFTGGTEIYTPPEAGQGLYTYNVAAHPTELQLLIDTVTAGHGLRLNLPP